MGDTVQNLIDVRVVNMSIVGEIIELGRLDRPFGVFIENLGRVPRQYDPVQVYFRGKSNIRLQVSGLSSESVTSTTSICSAWRRWWTA